MSRRITYSETFSGEADRGIRAIISGDDCGEGDYVRKLKKMMLNVINNELTARQKQIIMLYYFKDVDIVRIAELLEVSPQAVSAVMKRARLKIYRFLQYYL